jgi:hypothetical protein
MTSCIHLANEYTIAKSREEPQILTCVVEVFVPTEMTSEYLTKYMTSYSRREPSEVQRQETRSLLTGVGRYFFPLSTYPN